MDASGLVWSLMYIDWLSLTLLFLTHHCGAGPIDTPQRRFSYQRRELYHTIHSREYAWYNSEQVYLLLCPSTVSSQYPVSGQCIHTDDYLLDILTMKQLK
jgi:hypothetical protein